ncbi:hypothetical protein CQA49_08935 [Helicobacter sp. MIT 00-7814]|uniref:hypothetical protein n=1 Tax=unclassified Helicobacter TaxID=2593540 RepID=UPI000E1F6748|nr:MULTISPECIES: hypothetical protein [unclassified Helicobacter]RDU51953.1 hypothetical protein CQA49_08935 [Helicobacter sp. MIT 00-7814]RDU54123.1 hypothetical protein CQA37_05790 [Helicobacter sp. MIT 99-10781]
MAHLQVKNGQSTLTEQDLRPLLMKYLSENQDFRLYCKAINNEDKSEKRCCPDVVGVSFPFVKYHKVALEFLGSKIPNVSFYSFEIKKSLNWHNFREYYFRAILNSEWANGSYLVTSEIEWDLVEEINRLHEKFGIGLIKLEREAENRVLVYAKEHEVLDTRKTDDIFYTLVQNNSDFRDFVADVNNQIKTHAGTATNSPLCLRF